MRAGRSAGDLLDAEWDTPEVEGPRVEVPRRLVDVASAQRQPPGV